MFTNQEIDQAAKQAAAITFRPWASYDSVNDCLEFFATNDSFYAQSIDALVTIYCSHETGTPVGLRLKKVKKFFREFLKQSPGFRAEVEDHRLKVEHLFTAKIWALENPQDVRVLTYQRFREVAQENKVEAEIGDLADLVGAEKVSAFIIHGCERKGIRIEWHCRPFSNLRAQTTDADTLPCCKRCRRTPETGDDAANALEQEPSLL